MSQGLCFTSEESNTRSTEDPSTIPTDPRMTMRITKDQLKATVCKRNARVVEKMFDAWRVSPSSSNGFSKDTTNTTDFIHTRDENLLHLASTNDRDGIIKQLSKSGVDIDARTECGETALHISCQRSCISTVKTLLEYGADINISCNGGKTPYYSNLNLMSKKSFQLLFSSHVIKMQAAGWYVSEENLQMIESNCDTGFFRSDCEDEIQRMKNDKIFGNISYFDILTEDKNTLAMYTRTRSLRSLEQDCYEEKFPIYRGWINTNLKRGQRRHDLLERAADAFDSLINYELLHILSMEICRYTGNDDLQNLIATSEEN